MPAVTLAPDGSVHIAVKAVPGASRDQVSGLLGDRLKIRVSAPPEGGKANEAIETLLADRLGVRRRDVRVIHGHSSQEKTLSVSGISPALAAERLGIDR
ncbi:MAG: DUF167 domain-containing protein [Phycisphaerae bacterium]|nr:DUF167 domain-containing protein [Phycisphaerae bacterium]